MTNIKTRATVVADAYLGIARANHYMVGINPEHLPTDDELDGAYQALIDLDNMHSTRSTRLALDLIEHERAARRARAAGMPDP